MLNLSGSGKSTFTAYCLENYRDELKYLGDDVIRIDTKDKKLYGISSGQRLKIGSKKLFFDKKDMYSFEEEGNSIWIYKPENEIAKCFDMNSNDVRLVNISYKPSEEEKIREIFGTDKVASMLANIYSIKSNAANIFTNLSAFSNYHFFSVEYSDINFLSERLLNGTLFSEFSL